MWKNAVKRFEVESQKLKKIIVWLTNICILSVPVKILIFGVESRNKTNIFYNMWRRHSRQKLQKDVVTMLTNGLYLIKFR